MNEESNTGSEIEYKRPKTKGKVLDMQQHSPNFSGQSKQKQLELLITEEEILVWDLLSEGRTQKQVGEKLGVAQATVSNRINRALEKIRGWAGRQAEDWRNAQLLIIAKQISGIIDDTEAKAEPDLDADGEQRRGSTGHLAWIIHPKEAAKGRNMARITLAKYLEHQARLLNLTVERKEVLIEKKVVIGTFHFGELEDAASMDDL